MHFSISKNSDIPIAEQLSTQIILAIASNELKPFEKLPSTRELARRLSIHSNTINAVYHRLTGRGWLEIRPGSGVYARELKGNQPLEGCLQLDHMISAFLRMARERGFTLEEIKNRARLWLELQPPDHMLLIDPDRQFRQIIKAEILASCQFPVQDISLEEFRQHPDTTGAAPVCLYGLAEEVRARLPLDTHLLLLHTRPITEEVQKLKSLKSGTFLTVISHWTEFFLWARKMLAVCQLPAELLSFRDAREEGWQNGLGPHSFVLTDLLTAPLIPAHCPTLVFKIISQDSLQHICQYVADFAPAKPARPFFSHIPDALCSSN